VLRPIEAVEIACSAQTLAFQGPRLKGVDVLRAADIDGMCNLYSVTTNQEAIRRLFRVDRDLTGNLPSFPAIFPDQMAPVIRGGAEDRELAMLRWGMPCPPAYGGAHVINIRNTGSPHWRAWLKPSNRCLVPGSRVRLRSRWDRF